MSRIHALFIIPAMLFPACLALGESGAELAPNIAIGRENPFAQVTPAAKVPEMLDPQDIELAPQMPPVQAKPELFVETVMIKVLGSENLKTVFEKMLTPFGSIAVDAASNSLIICDTRDNLDKILVQVRKIDKTPQIIEIEVAIVDVALDSDTDIGFNWDMLSTNTDNPAYRQNFTSRLSANPANDDTIANATAYNSVGSGADISIVVGTVRNVLHLLQTKRQIEILAKPTVRVVSGKSASVETVEEIPYQEQFDSSQGGSFASTQFKEVGVKLEVTAMINDDNSIMLTVTPEQNINTGTFGINNIPIIDTRRAKSNLLLRDGQVVIMGGLRRKEKSKLRDQIPVLGSIPVVGKLFGRDKEVVVNSELMVFISPHIYRGSLKPEELANYRQINSLPPIPIDPNTIDSTKKKVPTTEPVAKNAQPQTAQIQTAQTASTQPTKYYQLKKRKRKTDDSDKTISRL
ncbi:MAG: hypothetical protein ABFC56_08970 [Clostridiaceae bacterium]